MKIGDKATVFVSGDPAAVVLIVSGNRRLKDDRGGEWRQNSKGQWVGYAGTDGTLDAYVSGDEERAARARLASEEAELARLEARAAELPAEIEDANRRLANARAAVMSDRATRKVPPEDA